MYVCTRFGNENTGAGYVDAASAANLHKLIRVLRTLKVWLVVQTAVELKNKNKTQKVTNEAARRREIGGAVRKTGEPAAGWSGCGRV